MMTSFANKSYRFAEWITRLAYVNLLWIIFSLLGMVVFGFSPATAAMFAVVRKWVSGDDDVPVFQTFWSTYRKEFVESNILGILLAVVGYLIYIEFSILRSQESVVYFVASYGVIAQLILYFIIVMYFFPIFVHFKLKLFDYIKWPFIIGIGHPIMTIFLAVVTNVLMYVVMHTVPILAFFFGGSVTAFILTWGISKTFSAYEKNGKADLARS